MIEPQLRGEPAALPDLTLAEFVPLYLERHAAGVRPRTIDALRWRLGVAIEAFGDVPLRDLERMSGEIAAWRATLPERSRYAITAALRQALGAAVRWRYMGANPAKLAGRNPQPAPRPVRAFTVAEVEAIAAELSPIYRPLPAFAAATGLRPEEWQALERRDVDRAARLLNVRRTVSSGEVVELGKTAGAAARCRSRAVRSTRSTRSRRGSTRRCCSRRPAAGCSTSTTSAAASGHRRSRRPGSRSPARIYDLRSTFASRRARGGRVACSSSPGSWARRCG